MIISSHIQVEQERYKSFMRQAKKQRLIKNAQAKRPEEMFMKKLQISLLSVSRSKHQRLGASNN